MAKSATGFPVTQGSGSNLSIFEMDNDRVRETVIIADSDESGEALHAELPAHGSPDRGSPLKIGGRGMQMPFDSVDESDRTDAWFTVSGQLGTVTTHEPAVVYDNGRKAVHCVNLAQNINNTSVEIVAAAPGLKTKVLGYSVFNTTITTGGFLSLRNGSGGGHVVYCGMVLAWSAVTPPPFILTPGVVMANGGYMICETSLNTALHVFYSGDAFVVANVLYYQAP